MAVFADVLEVLEVLRVPEVMRSVLLCMLEAMEGRLCLRRCLRRWMCWTCRRCRR